jgi:hypothetical protein
LAKTFNKVFETVDFVEKFSLSGGEPFLHSGLSEIIADILQYERQIGCLEVFSNGTIIPNVKVIEALKKSEKLMVFMDNYGPNISKNVNEIEYALKNNNIKYRVRDYYNEAHCGGWVDLGDYTKKHFSNEAVEDIFNRCAYSRTGTERNYCFQLKEGKLFPCPYYRRCYERKIMTDNPNEYVDFFDDSLSISEKRSKIAYINTIKSLTACAYCNGLCDDAPRSKPAEQL